METFPVQNLINAVVFAALGILVFGLSFIIVDRLTPYHLWKEVVQEQNLAVAVLVGAMSIGIAIIIAAAVH